MGRYINWESVTARYPSMADDKRAAAGVGSSFITGAEGEVDGRLAVKYTVPFTPAPDQVVDLCVDLVWYKMFLGNPKQVVELKRYIDQRFKDILEGRMALTTTAGLLGTAVKAFATESQYPTVFGHGRPENWRVSSQWLQDEADRRCQG